VVIKLRKIVLMLDVELVVRVEVLIVKLMLKVLGFRLHDAANDNSSSNNSKLNNLMEKEILTILL
jgi:hypothetical protein